MVLWKKHYNHLPLGLFGLHDIPAVPFSAGETLTTLFRLSKRSKQVEAALDGLKDHTYTIDGVTATGYDFLLGNAMKNKERNESAEFIEGPTELYKLIYQLFVNIKKDLGKNVQTRRGERLEINDETVKQLQTELEEKPTAGDSFLHFHHMSAISDRSSHATADIEDKEKMKFRIGSDEEADADPDPLTIFSLEDPTQFAIAWTTYWDNYKRAEPLLPDYAKTISDPEYATEQFWPNIANDGLAYNLLVLQKVTAEQIPSIILRFGDKFTEADKALVSEGRLFAIDLTIFSFLEPDDTTEVDRFTPSTFTLLQQDPTTKSLTPTKVWVAGNNGKDKQIFVYGSAKPGAWIYALQAAKTSVTVYGIWLGHVYHWHIVTAAMQMALHNTFDKGDKHPVYEFIAPTSDYLIGFDSALILLWGAVAPPASVDRSDFLQLCNRFSSGRSYFDDDPLTTLSRNGITKEDFSDQSDWDKYPIVKWYLKIWDAVLEFTKVFVETTYVDDSAVAKDDDLKEWISACKTEGNISGLPDVCTRADLYRVLSSLVYRVTAHGMSRLNKTANPALTFVANFPPTLQNTTIPTPEDDVPISEILKYLPNTGTIGKMVNFYYTFVFSKPYKPLIPEDGDDKDLYFEGGSTEPRNAGLIKFREAIKEIILEYEPASPDFPEAPQYHQWPLNIET